MARTPLFSMVRPALVAARRPTPPAPRAALHDPGRRRLLVGSAGAALTLPFVSAGCTSASQAPVAIVGGGLAGLHAAYRLQGLGLPTSVFEASQRLGGRVYTDRSTFASPSAQHCELGGERIDSDHATMRDLAAELGLDLLDYSHDDASLDADTAFFGGQRVGSGDLLAGFAPIAAALDAVHAQQRDPKLRPSYRDDNGLGAYDQLSISGWLDQIGAAGPVRQLLEVAYTAEYGLPTTEQSALNLISLLGTGTQALAVYGASDRRFHTVVGNDAFVAKLAAALDPAQVALEHRLVSVRAQSSGRYRLTFDHPDGTREVDADRVVLALPFSVLRAVDLSGLTLPDVKKQAIAELGYGTHSKLMVGFSSRQWRTLGADGSSFSDLPYQCTWDTSRLQGGAGGILTNCAGGQHGLDLAQDSADKQRDAFLAQIDQVFPGAAAASTGTVARLSWPTQPFNLGSVACYTVGQWTRFGGAEFERVGNLLFCGEHTSAVAPGSMEGAALTGAMVAEAIRSDLGLSMRATALGLPGGRIHLRARRALAQV